MGKNAHIHYIQPTWELLQLLHNVTGNIQCSGNVLWMCTRVYHIYCVCMVLVYSVMTCCLLAPSAPSSVTISGSRTVGYTQTLNLTCRVSGIANRFLWYHNGTTFSSASSSYSKSAQPRDSGSYKCKACNWAGCTGYSSILRVTVIG